MTGVVTLGIVTVVALAGGVLTGPGATRAERLDAARVGGLVEDGSVGSLLEGFAGGDTVGLVRRLEERVAADPEDGEALAALGLAYQQRARESGSPSYYDLSGLALARASAAGAPPAVVAQGRAGLANARHRFAAGLLHARRAVVLAPNEGSAYALLGDALLNLGRYREAFAAYDRSARLDPGIASYARVAHARALLGRRAAALDAYRLAIEAGSSVPEHLAWAKVQLGNAHFDGGSLGAAELAYREALHAFPGYVHALAGLGRVDAAHGTYRRAERRLRRAVEALPVPAYAALLGDVLTADGRPPAARRAYRLVDGMQRLLEAGGVRTELQTALLDLDRGRNLRDALRRARLAHRAGPSIQAEDVLAWALLRAGRCKEARAHSERALRLGTKDALMLFHRGLIERCLGSGSWRSWLGRALETNPHFSLRYAPAARALLQTA
jgi:tetratricopeptide (TPR) repeat protein